MALIARKGKFLYGEGLDLFQSYLAENKTKVTSVKLWGFERLPYGHLVVSFANGAIGSFTGPQLSKLSDHAHTQRGWPKPTLYTSALPYSAGMLYADDFRDSQPTEEEHDSKRVVRRRKSGGEPPVVRVRRVRAER
jgi:hypothetical protein